MAYKCGMAARALHGLHFSRLCPSRNISEPGIVNGVMWHGYGYRFPYVPAIGGLPVECYDGRVVETINVTSIETVASN